ncbi:MAG: hypothetical protein WBH31_05405, partial [Promethearchaeia archaeon]
IGAIVALIGYFVPYASYCMMGICIHLWLFGFVATPFGGYMLPWEGDFLTMGILGIIIVVLAVLALVFSILMKKREESKVMKILLIVFGAVILVLGILPPLLATGYYAVLLGAYGIGFFLIVIGGALLVLFGILGLALK